MKYLALIGLIILTGCGAEPIQTSQTGNANVSAAMIANVDGCRIWRVEDGSARKIYFARCPEGSVRTSWDVTSSTGKTSYTEHLETLGSQ